MKNLALITGLIRFNDNLWKWLTFLGHPVYCVGWGVKLYSLMVYTPVIHVITWIYYSFTDPKGMEGWVGLVGWPVADTLFTKWSHVNNISGVDRKFRQSETDVLTTEPRRQPWLLARFNVIFCGEWTTGVAWHVSQCTWRRRSTVTTAIMWRLWRTRRRHCRNESMRVVRASCSWRASTSPSDPNGDAWCSLPRFKHQGEGWSESACRSACVVVVLCHSRCHENGLFLRSKCTSALRKLKEGGTGESVPQQSWRTLSLPLLLPPPFNGGPGVSPAGNFWN